MPKDEAREVLGDPARMWKDPEVRWAMVNFDTEKMKAYYVIDGKLCDARMRTMGLPARVLFTGQMADARISSDATTRSTLL